MIKKRILCVDDVPEILRLLSYILKDYQVAAALTVTDALKQIRTNEFDLYILESNLADGTGLDVAAKIRESDPSTPIIFFTSAMDYEIDKRIDANSLIRKNSANFVQELEAKVHELLDKK